MIWQLSDDYRVRTIPMNFVLEEYREIKPKDKPAYHEWTFLGNYSGLRSVLHALPDWVALRDDTKTLEGLLVALEALADDITERIVR